MSKIEETVKLFENGLNCSQAILAVFGEQFGVDIESAKKLGRPLGGGIGRMGRTCGAVTGAIMVLGLAQEGTLAESDARNQIAGNILKLVRRFEERHGTSECRELLTADFTTEAGMKRIKEEKLVSRLCPPFVRDAAEILSEIIGP